MNLFLILSLIYFVSFILGWFLEKFRISWLFAPLFFGMLLSLLNIQIKTQELDFLSELGLIFLFFIIGFELNVKDLLNKSKHLFLVTVFIFLIDSILGSILISSYGYPLFISLICALSFATVGEGILLPILDEFKLLRKKLGEYILGIGIFDDVFEVILISLVGIMIGSSHSLYLPVLSLLGLFFVIFIIINLKLVKRTLKIVPEMEDLFLFTLFVLFLLTFIGSLGNLEVLGALIAGIVLKNFIPKKHLDYVERIISIFSYGVFIPIFFFVIGNKVDIWGVIFSPILTLSIFLVSLFAKIIGSIISSRKVLGFKKSILMGIGLSVRFSTSLVITQILFSNNLIDLKLFSALISASSLSTILVPILFSYFIKNYL